MTRLWEKLRHRWNRIRIWFWMRSIKKDFDRIDSKLNKPRELDKSTH